MSYIDTTVDLYSTHSSHSTLSPAELFWHTPYCIETVLLYAVVQSAGQLYLHDLYGYICSDWKHLHLSEPMACW